MPYQINTGAPKRKSSLLDTIGDVVSTVGAVKGVSDLGGKVADTVSSLVPTPPPAPPGNAPGIASVDEIPEMQPDTPGGTLGDAISRKFGLINRGLTMRR